MLFLSCRSNNLSFFLQKKQKFAPFRAAFKHNSFSHFSFLLWNALYFAVIFCKYGMYFWFTLHPPPPKGVHPGEGGGTPKLSLCPEGALQFHTVNLLLLLNGDLPADIPCCLSSRSGYHCSWCWVSGETSGWGLCSSPISPCLLPVALGAEQLLTINHCR